MKRGLTLAVVVGMAALVVWWLLRDGVDQAPPAATAPQELTTQVANQAPPDRDASPVAIATAPEATRIAPASPIVQPPIPADAPWLDVLVVDGTTDQPVAGAEVLWATSSMYIPVAERELRTSAPDGAARRFGWHTRTDANGRARVAADANGATVHAMHDGRYAMGHIGGKQPVPAAGWRLVLATDLTLRVLVLDAADRPAAGITVAIRADAPAGSVGSRGRIAEPQTTSPTGIAEFRHLQQWRGRGERDAGESPHRLRAVALLPSLESAEATFDLAAPPAEPIVIRLPPTGRLLAQLRHEGRPVTAGVVFQAIGADASMEERMLARLVLGPGAPGDAEGWGHFPHVPLGRSFTVYARWADNVLEANTTGPLHADEEVRVELTTADVITMVGRLLGPDDQPLANAVVGVSFHVEGGQSGGARIDTDAAGRFVCQLARSTQPRALLRHLWLTLGRSGASTLRATLPPRDVVVGRNDLGDIRMAIGPLVVAGRIVFDPPDPSAYASLSVEALAEARAADGKEQWKPQNALIMTQHPDGTFEVRGEAQPARHRLRVSGRMVPIAPREFRTGDSDVSIVLTSGHELTATCLIPAGLRDLALRGVLRPTGAPPNQLPDDELGLQLRQHLTRQGTAAGDGSDRVELRWQLVPAGTYTLDLEVLGMQAPLATVPDLLVPQPTPGDPRLTGLDVRDRIRRLTVRVTTDSGPTSADDSTLVFVMPQADPLHWTGFSTRGDEVQVYCPPGPAELQVLREGFRPARITAGEGVTTIRLERWPSLELRFPGLPELPDGVTLHGRLSDVDAVPTPDFQTATTGGSLASLRPMRRFEVKNARATLAPGEGTFDLALYLAGNGARRPLRSFTPGRLVGTDSQAPIVVQLAADEVRTLLAELAALRSK